MVIPSFYNDQVARCQRARRAPVRTSVASRANRPRRVRFVPMIWRPRTRVSRKSARRDAGICDATDTRRAACATPLWTKRLREAASCDCKAVVIRSRGWPSFSHARPGRLCSLRCGPLTSGARALANQLLIDSRASTASSGFACRGLPGGGLGSVVCSWVCGSRQGRSRSGERDRRGSIVRTGTARHAGTWFLVKMCAGCWRSRRSARCPREASATSS